MRSIFTLLNAYWQTKHLMRLNPEALKLHQAQKIRSFLMQVCQRSAYFAPYRSYALECFPLMDKTSMLANFDRMNTAGLHLEDVMYTALQAEHCRDFKPTLGGFTVGLSSGTTGQRGAFVVSSREKSRWAGVMLAKTLPDGLFAVERIALFLRANSNLYTSVSRGHLRFDYFDLFLPFDNSVGALNRLQPTLLIAPAQVLRRLAEAQLAGDLCVKPKRVYSVAEVLEKTDRHLIDQAFGNVHEIYQATEGFLASTCEYGVLHLNEEHVHIEPEWLDVEKRRFIPIITDFNRITQPIIRYRLNDVLTARAGACTCGRASMALETVEGRLDDCLLLPDKDGKLVFIFADMLNRALAHVLPVEMDYRCTQVGATQLCLQAALSHDIFDVVIRYINQCLTNLGVAIDRLQWHLDSQVPIVDHTRKRRRIQRTWRTP